MKMISEIANEFHKEFPESHVAIKAVTERLVENGLLFQAETGKRVTKSGEEAGIREERKEKNDRIYYQLSYDENAEKLARDIMKEIYETDATKIAKSKKTATSEYHFSAIPEKNNIADAIKLIRKGVNPWTGEVFNLNDLKNIDVFYEFQRLGLTLGVKVQKPESRNRDGRNIQAIFDELKAWRLDKASEEAMPPYVIFSNTELYSIAEGDVECKEDLVLVKGISSVKYEKYGDELWDILKDYQ